jgi:hypothetical protein
VLIIDDFAMDLLKDHGRRPFWRCTMILPTATSVLKNHLAVSRRHKQIGNPTIADSILEPLPACPNLLVSAIESFG